MYRSGQIDLAMHCCFDKQSFKSTGREWREWTGRESASHSAQGSPHLQRKTQHGFIPGQTFQKGKSSVGLTAPKCMHIGPWMGNRVTYEGRMWHLSWALTDQKAAVVLTALTMGHQGHGDKAGLLSEEVSVHLSLQDIKRERKTSICLNTRKTFVLTF